MEHNEFHKLISSLNPDSNIIGNGSRGSEENVKIKFVIPLLQVLGYDIIQDMDFERSGADIVLLDRTNKDLKPFLIVETKTWGEPVRNHLKQCFEYCFKLQTPNILVTSGKETYLYSALNYQKNVNGIQPILCFRFYDLLGERGSLILKDLRSFVGKKNLLGGAEKLYEQVKISLPSNKTLDQVFRDFNNECKKPHWRVKTQNITSEKFVKLAQSHPLKIRKSLLLIQKEFTRIEKDNKENLKIEVKYQSREMGLKASHKTKLREKLLGLVGVNPKKAKVAVSKRGWSILKCPRATLRKIESFPKNLKSEKQARQLIRLIETGLKEIQVG
jgi:hypothetical protein